MRDKIGRVLMRWRIKTALPHVRGYLLDIGCGTNQLVRTYREKLKGSGLGVDVYGWEGVDLVVKDSSKLPFASESVDTVAMLAVFNHIPNRDRVLLEARRLLRAKGRLIMTMIPPGISRVWHILRSPWDADQKERGMKEGELFGLTQKEVRRFLTDAGFEIKLEKRFMFGVNGLTVAERR
jgi:SAM-dependent methyltransferase